MAGPAGLGDGVRVVAPTEFDLTAARGAAAEFITILDQARRFDGASAVDEATLLELRDHGLAGHCLLFDSHPSTGFVLVSTAGALDLVVAPDARAMGAATRLLTGVPKFCPVRPVTAWAHGSHPAAARLAARFGFVPARELWRMERDLESPTAPPHQAPPGVVIRTFEVGRDETAFLAANTAAFAAHPEQGDLALSGLTARMAQPWFDPAAFFLAERHGTVVGFHWTKVLPESPDEGEVYVIGVTPTEQGTGLGRHLLEVGLAHLHERGVRRVSLYVEAVNEPAIRLYENRGFAHVATDVQYVTAET